MRRFLRSEHPPSPKARAPLRLASCISPTPFSLACCDLNKQQSDIDNAQAGSEV